MTDEGEAGRTHPPGAGAKKAAVKKAGARKAAVKKAGARKAAVKKAGAKKALPQPAPSAKRAQPAAAPPVLDPPLPSPPPPPAPSAASASSAPSPPPAPSAPPPPPPPSWPPPGWPSPAWPPPPPLPPPAPPREGLATAALVAGIVSIPLVLTIIGAGLVGFSAIVVGIAALWRIRANPERSGRGMAIGGLVMGVLSLVLTVLFLVAISDDEDPNELESVSYLDLSAGDCFDRSRPSRSGVTPQDCEIAHDREVVGVVDHPGSPWARYPGREVLEVRARDLCAPLYDDYVGPDRAPAILVLATLQPTRQAWIEGNRRIVCSVERVDRRPLVGSVTSGARPVR